MAMALVRLFALFIALCGVNATGGASSKLRREYLQTSASNNGLFGVASVAGIANRNGRISSLGGIQFYPGMDSSIRVTNDGNTYYYTSPNDQDKYATGSVEVYPGSVVVSSTTRSGIDRDYKPMPLSLPVSRNNPVPSPKEFFYQPLPNFFEKSRTFQPIDPWFLSSMLTFNNPPKPEDFDAWIYPNLNQIFSFWR